MRISDWSSDVCSSDLIEPEVDAANGLRLKVAILVVDILHAAHRIDAGAGEEGDVVRRGREAEDGRVARSLNAGQVIRDQRIAFAEHADDALLLHLPIVEREEIGRASCRERVGLSW